MASRGASWVAAATVSASGLAIVAASDGCAAIPCGDNDTCYGYSDAAPSPGEAAVDSPFNAGDAGPDVTVSDGVSSNDGSDGAQAADVTLDTGPSGDADASLVVDGEDGGDARDSADVADGADAADGADVADGADAGDGADAADAAEVCNGNCADPACVAANWECVPSWQPGWTAPVLLYYATYDGGSPPDPAPCAAPYANDIQDGYNDPVPPKGSCSCTCGPAEGAECSEPFILASTTNVCGGGNTITTSVPLDGGCVTVGTADFNSGLVLDAGVSFGGSCAEIETTSVPRWDAGSPTEWGALGRVCAAPPQTYRSGDAGGCPANYTCVQAPPGPLAPNGVCLLSPGDVGCPSTGYTHQYFLFDGGFDGRTCSFDCGCGAPTGVSCTPSVELFSSGTCSGASMALTETCPADTPWNFSGTVKASATFGASPGTCVADSGATQLTGAPEGTGQVTVCCNGP
jgi:hypothetical protein